MVTFDDNVVSNWLNALSYATNEEASWRNKAKKVIETYRNDRGRWHSKSPQYNILWSNIEVLKPALYAETPKPDVRRRFHDDDQVGKKVSEAIERSLQYSMEKHDFDHVMQNVLMDYLLTGRGIARLSYFPAFEKEQMDEVKISHVHWDDFRRGPGRNWDEVEWIAFKHYLSHADFIKQFGGAFDDIAPNYNPSDAANPELNKAILDQVQPHQRHVVWEIWDKVNLQTIFITDNYIDNALKIVDDPYGLEGFYPIVRPLMSFEDANSLIPVPEYWCYKDQAEELNRVSDRITKLVSVMKARGIYDSRLPELQDVMSLDDAELVPAENVGLLSEQGGLGNSIWFLPVEALSRVLSVLYGQREQIKHVIYEITGISDILRGTSHVNETATAQNIKAQFGSLRLQRRQMEIQRFSRDLLRLKSEIIGQKFDRKSLMKQTGMILTHEMMGLLKDHQKLGYRVEVSTMNAKLMGEQVEQRQFNDAMQAIVSLMHALTPAVNDQLMSRSQMKGLLLAVMRRFKFGKEIESAFENIEVDQSTFQTPEYIAPKGGIRYA